MRMSLEHIQLDPDEGNKPAEVITNDGTDNSSQSDQSPAEAPTPATEAEDLDSRGSDESAATGDNGQADQSGTAVPGEAPAPAGATEGSDTKPAEPVDNQTPWHQNPEWQQMQSRLKAAEERAEAAERLANEAKQSSTPTEVPDLRNPNVIAEEAIAKKYEEGWKPKDGLEQTRLFNEIKDEALAKQQAYHAKVQQETDAAARAEAKAAQTAIKSVVDTEKLTPEQEKLARAEAVNIVNSGITGQPDALMRLAISNLRSQGQLPKAGAAEPSRDNPVKVTKEDSPQTKEQSSTNSKISRPSSDGGNVNGTPKKSIQEIRALGGLEGIIHSHAEEFNK